eukprot:TRINITY_DN14803_c0_g1_i1.p1 TRINITY_DN14803_c0_g1~~TRINITY_DN14803_c0_g1_i1.p1  ORF type:complete len:238 (+),score=24.83 TRINITY_DN14803_c0_g1_i1:303-1016(+)
MGITTIVALNATAIVGLLACLRGKVKNQKLLLPLVHASVVGYVAAISAHPVLNRPYLFGKNRQGRFPLWSMAAFYPYLIPLRHYVRGRRVIQGEPVYSEVSPGLFVGGWPSAPCDVPPGNPAVVDCTCELPRNPCLEGLPYFCIPTWDSRAPSPLDIDRAVKWASQQYSQGRPVFVHCAFGHGRSVAVMCALLVSLGLSEDWKGAEKMIKDCRPAIGMNIEQRKSVDIWSQRRPSIS